MTSRIEFRCMNKEQINTLSYLLRDELIKQPELIDIIQSEPTRRIVIDDNNTINLIYFKSFIILSTYKYFDFNYCRIYPDGRYKYFDK